MSSLLEKGVIEELNNFRQNPKGIKHQLEVLKKGISRLRPKDTFLQEIDDFIAQLPRINNLKPLSVNKHLTQAAKAEVKKFTKDENYKNFQTSRDLKGIVPDGYLKENVVLIADDGMEEAETVVSKLLLNKIDKARIGRNAVISPDTTQVGVAIQEFDGENYLIILFANAACKDDSEPRIPDGDLTELKMAFDLYDHDGSQKIRIQEALNAMKSMKFDQKNPELYTIIEELNDQEWCGWPRFAAHVTARITDRTTDEGLTTLFNLFIDDPKKQTITLETFKRICKEVGESLSDDEMRTILRNTTENGNEITLMDFINFMKSTE